MDFSQIELRPGNRALLCGMTGSGKTFLGEYLLKNFPFVVILDMKGVHKWNGFKQYDLLAKMVTDDAAAPIPRVVYSPRISEMNDEKIWDNFFQWVYLRKNTLLFIDEVYSVTSKWSIPLYYKAILTRGRERGITCLSATQRPKDIPQELMSESEQFYIFRLQMPQDRKRISDIIPLPDDEMRNIQKKQFYYIDTQEDIRAGPLKLKEIEYSNPAA